jgi:hypothetical protein
LGHRLRPSVALRLGPQARRAGAAGPVNPLTLKIAQGRTLAGRELANFLQTRLKIDETLAAMPLETQVSDISTDLRQAKAR